jgi:hypothetical protein
VACYGPGSGAMSCQNIASDNEAYFANSGRGNTRYDEPKIHDGGATFNVPPTNVTLQNDRFYRLSTRDSANLHNGCLMIQYGAGGGPVTLDGDTFEQCSTYDVLIDSGTNDVTIQNGQFDSPKKPIQAGNDFGVEPSASFSDVEYKCVNGGSLRNFLIRFNTFTNGPNLNFGGCGGVSYTNVRTIGNILGTPAGVGCVGNVIAFNLEAGGACGSNARTVSRLTGLVVSSPAPFDLHLAGPAGSTPADNYVTPVGGDFALGSDVDGQARSAPRDAGADER